MYRSFAILKAAILKAALAAAILLAAGGAAAADDAGNSGLSDEQRDRLEARLGKMSDRLALSEEQKAQLGPVLRKDFEKRAEVMRKHGVTRGSEERPDRREMRALRRDLKAVSSETDAEIERILDDRQLQEFRRMQEEARDEMRDRMRSRRQESTEGL